MVIQTSLYSVCSKTTQGQNSPVCLAQAQLASSLYDTTQKMVRIAKFSPRKNQSERLESTLPYNIGFIHKVNKC